MLDVELPREGGPDDGPAQKGEDEEARRFILQVKKIIERCLHQGMDKAEMFRTIREQGLPPWIAFSVFKELREQNYDFFKEYYCMHSLKEQREKLGRLIQAFRTTAGGGNAAAGALALETATTTPAAMETDAAVNIDWSNQPTDAWFDLEGEFARHLGTPIGGDDQFAGTQAMCFPGIQQPPHDDPQTTVCDDDDWLREMQWGEEAVPMLAPHQQLRNRGANGMFPGVAWPQQAVHPPALPQLHHQEPAVHMLAPGQQLLHQEPAVHMPAAGQQLHYLASGQQLLHQEPAVHMPAAGQQLHYLEKAVHLPAGQQLPYQQQPAHLPVWYQEQLVVSGGFHGAPPPSTAGLLSSGGAMMDSWPLSQGGHGFGQGQQLVASGVFHRAPLTSAAGLPHGATMDTWPLSQGGQGFGQGQQGEPLMQQWWPHPSPSPTLPGGELLGNKDAAAMRASTNVQSDTYHSSDFGLLEIFGPPHT